MNADRVGQRLEVVDCKRPFLEQFLFTIFIDVIDEEVFSEIANRVNTLNNVR